MTASPEITAKPTTLRGNADYQTTWMHAARVRGVLSKDSLSREFARHVEQHPEHAYCRRANPDGVRKGRTHAGRLLGEVRDRGDVAPTPMEFNIAYALAGSEGQLEILLEMEGSERMPQVMPIPCTDKARLELADLFSDFSAALRSGESISEIGPDLASLILGLVAGQKENP